MAHTIEVIRRRPFHMPKTIWVKWAFVMLTLIVTGTAICILLPVVRVGDGMEYYAMFYAWSDTIRPWMTEQSFALYQQLHDSGKIIGTLDRSFLENAFPALRVGDTADFNHFWFYSLLAAAINAPMAAIGLPLGPHLSFLILHGFLLIGLLGIALFCNGRHGFYAIALLTFGSPIIWYFNKVHTEFFTYCVTLAAIILAMRNQLVPAAVLIAFAATQNPGLSVVSVFLIALRGLSDWRVSYSRWEVMGIVCAVFLLALHPVYYLIRYEVVTPQLLAGGAEPGSGISFAYIWLIDPDVGLFPNWPFGLVALIAGVGCWRFATTQVPSIAPVRSIHLWSIIGVFLLASLYSHASTQNLNSGATPGLARYALWYIPLIYPAALSTVSAISALSNNYLRLLSSGAIGVGVLATAGFYLSVKWESYNHPSFSSDIIQTYIPWLYNPPAEIFRERYSGISEEAGAAAVVGPDCRKVLLIPPDTNSTLISVPENCSFGSEQIHKWVSEERTSLTEPRYATINPANTDIVVQPTPIEIGFLYPHDITAPGVRLSGWYSPEPQHSWSKGQQSSFRFSLPPSEILDVCLIVGGFTYQHQTVSAIVDGQTVMEQMFEGDARLVVPLGKREGPVTVKLTYSDPQSPPNDQRSIAFGIRTFQINACP